MNIGFPIRISVLNYDESKKSDLVSAIESIHVKLPHTLLVLDATVPEVEHEWDFKTSRYNGCHSECLKTDFVIDLDDDYEFEIEEYVSLMNTFNELCHTSDIGDEELTKASKELLGIELPVHYHHWLKTYIVADREALYFQEMRKKMTIMIAGLIPLAGFFAKIYGKSFGRGWFIILYPVVFLIIAGLVKRENSLAFKNKHVDYRGIAEAIRVKLYLEYLGLDYNIVNLYPLHIQLSENDWLLNGLNSLDNSDGTIETRELTEEDFFQRLDLVLNQWIRGQSAYLKSKSGQLIKHLDQSKKRSKATFYSSLGIAVLIFVNGYLVQIYSNTIIKDLIAASLPFLPTVGAALMWYAGRMNYGETVKRYNRLRLIYDHIDIKVSEAVLTKNREEASRQIITLAKEALAENYQWIQDNRSVSLRP